MANITAAKAFQIAESGLPEAATLVTAKIKAGEVSKVFQGDLNAMKKVSKKYMEFLTKNALISTDEKTAKAKSGGGVGHGKNTEAIKTALGPVFAEVTALKVKVNGILKAKGVLVDYQPFFRSISPAAPATPAPAAPATK